MTSSFRTFVATKQDLISKCKIKFMKCHHDFFSVSHFLVFFRLCYSLSRSLSESLTFNQAKQVLQAKLKTFWRYMAIYKIRFSQRRISLAELDKFLIVHYQITIGSQSKTLRKKLVANKFLIFILVRLNCQVFPTYVTCIYTYHVSLHVTQSALTSQVQSNSENHELIAVIASMQIKLLIFKYLNLNIFYFKTNGLRTHGVSPGLWYF